MRGKMVAAAGLLWSLAGCQADVPTGFVEGTLHHRGQPIQDVVIVFLPKQNGAGARIRSLAQPDAQGRFQLRTEQGAPGAVVGRHTVILEDLQPYHAPRSNDGTLLTKPVERFPVRYTDPLHSPWTVDVKAGSQTVELTIDEP